MTETQGFSLADQLFNETSLGDLAAEYAAVVPGFHADEFHTEAMGGMAERGLLERLEWIADCVEKRLSPNFPEMAAQLEAAMPPPLDSTLTDDDFGRFIHAVPGILAVRHGLENHRERALDLLHRATRRFSMEFYIRPFLNRWPQETMARLLGWAEDENYHVRRLVSEGTRPKLPWAKKLTLDAMVPLPLLDRLHGDPTRYVTRSVANHLNDIAKIAPDAVVTCLIAWQAQAHQNPKELAWMTRQALRTLVKQGHSGALNLLGFRQDVDISCTLSLGDTQPHIGQSLSINAQLRSPTSLPILVDYILHFHRPNGRLGQKVFKLKQASLTANKPLILKKNHPLKGNATTFTLHPGPHRVDLQINGKILASTEFELRT